MKNEQINDVMQSGYLHMKLESNQVRENFTGVKSIHAYD